MSARILRGTKQEIVEHLTRMSGEIREAIVFVEETPPTGTAVDGSGEEDLFAEMRPFMVDGAGLDDSREAIYSRMEGE
jgi:hypothetical protein